MNERATTSTSLSWLALACTVVVAVLVWLPGCTETPIDGSSADTTLRVPPKEDTTVVGEQRTETDTIVESDHIVVIDTVIREIIVRDTVRLYDTVVIQNRHARHQVREAVVFIFNERTRLFDSVETTFQPTIFSVTKGSPEWRLKFEATFQLSRLFPESVYGRHEMGALYVHIPDAPLREGALRLDDDPNKGMGASLIWRDRLYRSTPFNSGSFLVERVVYDTRMLLAEFTGGFPVAPSTWKFVKVRMRLSY